MHTWQINVLAIIVANYWKLLEELKRCTPVKKSFFVPHFSKQQIFIKQILYTGFIFTDREIKLLTMNEY
jgi:hypothetical protein